MEIAFKRCAQEDAPILQCLSRKTFRETFSGSNMPTELQAYLDKAYCLQKLCAKIANPDSAFYFLYLDGTLAGYCKLNESPAQTEIHDPASLEIERFYIQREYQGMGLGGRLMHHALDTARMRKKAYVWLGVWEKTKRLFSFIISMISIAWASTLFCGQR